MGGARFGRFALLERIGTGGAGEVLLVADGVRRLALKRLLPHVEDAAAAAAFDREAALAARLRHRNVVTVLEHGRVDGVRYVLMELVDGKSLHQLLRACDRLPAGAAAFVALEVSRALAYVHALADDGGRPLALVHRDVSPSNVLVSRAGEVKLCDFGIAKVSGTTATRTQPGFIKGKRGYLSPEQESGETLDVRSDLFAVGVVLFEALTGRRPRAGEIPSQLVAGVPPALDGVCARTLAAARDERHASAAELVAVLEPIVAERRGEAELAACMARWCPPRANVGDDPTHTLARLGGRRRWMIAAVAAGIVAATAFVVARHAAPPAAQSSTPPSAATSSPVATTSSPAATPPPPPIVSPPRASPGEPSAHTRPSRRVRKGGPAPAAAPKRHDYMPDPFDR
jgi:serine/threonine protein kinase